jgi:hypothetical protein
MRYLDGSYILYMLPLGSIDPKQIGIYRDF